MRRSGSCGWPVVQGWALFASSLAHLHHRLVLPELQCLVECAEDARRVQVSAAPRPAGADTPHAPVELGLHVCGLQGLASPRGEHLRRLAARGRERAVPPPALLHLLPERCPLAAGLEAGVRRHCPRPALHPALLLLGGVQANEHRDLHVGCIHHGRIADVLFVEDELCHPPPVTIVLAPHEPLRQRCLEVHHGEQAVVSVVSLAKHARDQLLASLKHQSLLVQVCQQALARHGHIRAVPHLGYELRQDVRRYAAVGAGRHHHCAGWFVRRLSARRVVVHLDAAAAATSAALPGRLRVAGFFRPGRCCASAGCRGEQGMFRVRPHWFLGRFFVQRHGDSVSL
mmetsp:Transcript_14833/g.28587  ORF Transcript_14833/g.28587 Transcript_14833/m.28587 type:complete len:342 (+) Transcript_14833:1687-2712(+)